MCTLRKKKGGKLTKENNNYNELIPLPDYVGNILKMLENAGFEGYAVGGCVRDFLMGNEPKDYDITTNAKAEQTEQIFHDYHVIETGIKHGTVTVMSDGNPIEITTYRIDGTYSDSRRPDSVSFTADINEDLARRDFTMNAIAYSPSRGFADEYGGVDDIAAGIIRCVGNPNRRFGEDALRIMRAIRFASVLGFTIEPKTAKAIHRNKHLLINVAKERITSEFLKLICGVNAASVMREYSDVIAQIIPPAGKMFGFEQYNPHHIYDVWEHTLHVLDNVPSVTELRLAALLHDIGKPHCRTFDSEGIGHFYGHAKISEQISQKIFENYLRLPRKTSEMVCSLVSYHDYPLEPDFKLMRKRRIKFGEEALRMLLLLNRGDVMGQAPEYMDRIETLNRCTEILDEIASSESCFSVSDLAVNGEDLMNEGIPQGRNIGVILKALLDEINDERLTNEKASLLKRAVQLNNKLYQNEVK